VTRVKKEKKMVSRQEGVVVDMDVVVAQCITAATIVTTTMDIMMDPQEAEAEVATVDEVGVVEGEDVEAPPGMKMINSSTVIRNKEPPRLSRRRSLKHLRLPLLLSRVPVMDRQAYRPRHVQWFA